MDIDTNKLVLCFGTVITLCAVIMAAGTVMNTTSGTVTSEDLSGWEELAADLEKKGGELNYATGATSPRYHSILPGSKVTAEHGFLKVNSGSHVYAFNYSQILYVSVNIN